MIFIYHGISLIELLSEKLDPKTGSMTITSRNDAINTRQEIADEKARRGYSHTVGKSNNKVISDRVRKGFSDSITIPFGPPEGEVKNSKDYRKWANDKDRHFKVRTCTSKHSIGSSYRQSGVGR
jgi:hypothetical protein